MNITKKQKVYRAFYLIVTFFLIGIPSISLGQISYSVNFSNLNPKFNSIIEEDGITYEAISLFNLRQSNEIGKPQLPVKYIRLIIPADKDVANIMIKKKEIKEFHVFHFIYPVQPSVPTTSNYGEMQFVNPDTKVYGSDQPYPSEIVKVVHEGYFDGSNHIITLAVYPLQYYPKSGRLVFFSAIDFSLKMKSAKTKAIYVQSRSPRNQKMYDSILKRIVDNPRDIPLYQTHSRLQKERAIQSGPVPFYEYVIITSSDLKSSFDTFVSWKRRKGLDIGIVTTDEIFTNYGGDYISGIYDDAGKIRQYLSDAYQSGTVWALLGGDYTVVPVRYGCGQENDWDDYVWDGTKWVTIVDAYKIPADLYFADFNGDWDVDGDQYTGEEFGDNPDYNPEIFVGRLLCSSSQDVKNWTEKALKYEQNPGNGDYAYLGKSFMMESDQMQSQNQAEAVANKLPSFFTHTIWKEIPSASAASPTFPSASEVINEMNNHYGLFSWFAHGEPNQINTKSSGYNNQPRYAINTVDNNNGYHEVSENGDALDCLNNEKYPAILYSIGCNNTPFDDYKISTYTGRNLGEGFTVVTNAGGPIFLGNTRYGWVDYSYKLYEEFADLISSGSNDQESGKSFFHLGVAEGVSKQNYIGGYSHYLRYSHNLIGDPETEMWTNTPSKFSNVVITDNSSSITVNSGVSGTDICVSSGNNGANYFLMAHNVSSYTFTTTVRPLYITITKHNYIPYTAVTGGTFTSNEIWFGMLNVLGSVVFDGNHTLTILPGSNIIFNGYCGMAIKAGSKIIAQGASLDSIYFTTSISNPGRQSWGNIYVYSGNNDLEYCTFEYGNWALKIYGYPSHTGGNIVKNCTFKHNDQALRIENSDVQVENSTLENNRHAFVLINAGNSSGIYLYGNTIQNNDRDGIYASHSTVDLFHNTIRQNGLGNSSTYNGIYAYNYCDIALGGREWEDEEDYDLTGGFNAIQNNHGSGIYVSSGSEVLVGDYGDPDICMAGHNSIYSNGSYSGKQIYNVLSGYTVKARDNYWGGTPTSSLFYGSVDSSSWLSTDPLSGGNMMAISPGRGQTPVLSKVSGGDKDTSIKISRIQKLKSFISQYPRSPKAVLALREIFHYIRGDYEDKLGMRQSIASYLSGLCETYTSDEIGKIALQLLVISHESSGDISGAISLAEKGIKLLEGEARNNMMATLVTYYIQQNQLEKAQALYKELKRVCPENKQLLEMVSEDLSDAPGREGKGFEKGYAIAQNKKQLPVHFALSQNYPNPFNPTTTISYQLPEAAHVTVAIYDLQGRLVETLVNGEKAAGSYSVQWDAGSQPSGVYFYKIQAGRFAATKKLLLLK